ncbi:VOC family protein [Streptomyces sp. NPDC101234]|uniref:VOC family protein n=1 Tax=Streptomyces sp. NPDC101234 TaxID=3366138 RepID=UPI003818AC7C
MSTPPPSPSTEASAEAGDQRGRARGLGHIVLYVSDLKRSLVFYGDILGWPLMKTSAEYPFAGFRAGDTHHDLMLIEVGRHAAPIPRGRRLGMYHFGVRVGDSDDDLRALLARIQAHPDLVTVRGMVDEGFAHSIYVEDPDGNEVELYVDIPGADWSPEVVFNTSPSARRPLRL